MLISLLHCNCITYYAAPCLYMYVGRYEKMWTVLHVSVFLHTCIEMLALCVGDVQAVPLVFCLVFKEYFVHTS